LNFEIFINFSERNVVVLNVNVRQLIPQLLWTNMDIMVP